MRRVESVFLLVLFVSIGLPNGLMAANLDLSGWWGASEVGQLELKQSGNKVIAKQNDPDIAAALGENMFVGELSGNVIKGKVATFLAKEKKAFCGKNWANWVDFELTVSPDGNSLNGKWLQGHHTITEKGCPLATANWEPVTLTRAALPLEDDTMSTNYLPGGLLLLGLSVVFFFIRNAYVNYLVGNLKRSPNSAGLAGTSLFLGLLFGSAIGCAALISMSYWVLWVIAPLGALSLICFISCIVVTSRK